ncbi:MAG TPA: phospholipase D-like domain-containing protein [Spirochaetota bacterium]|nr:phospholipase D-like domain-containing protein [Spirochaetota bacterium]HOM09661.1 phospholipase D-like domain-containing protein [Spirochaetota bacterium]HPP50431.1 phospholipase D-like domain-containing protein [Spirochaetota bacterium]HXK65341.1 phospholipase D-like domain-containing protein [Spirochaetota bacterium]
MKHYTKLPIVFLLIITVYSFVYAQLPIEVYFTTPEKEEQTTAIQKALLQKIHSTKTSIYAALFEITDPLIIDALCKAKSNGIDVRLVLESDRLKEKVKTKLEEANIPLRLDERKGFMHNKFFIFDNKAVWTGSYNITEREAKHNNNNAIYIENEEIASIYLAEFNEMFVQAIFGNRTEYTPFPFLSNKYYVKINDIDINVYFSPDDDIERIITKRIEKAKKSILFLAFSFTSDAIGEAIIAKHKQGIAVKGVFEKRDIKNVNSEYIKLKVEGLDVLYDANPKTMHHKVIIIDDEWVITGSYNFSKNARKRNDENCIMIRSSEIAKLYAQEFEKIYSQAYRAKTKKKK